MATETTTAPLDQTATDNATTTSAQEKVTNKVTAFTAPKVKTHNLATVVAVSPLIPSRKLDQAGQPVGEGFHVITFSGNDGNSFKYSIGETMFKQYGDILSLDRVVNISAETRIKDVTNFTSKKTGAVGTHTKSGVSVTDISAATAKSINLQLLKAEDELAAEFMDAITTKMEGKDPAIIAAMATMAAARMGRK